MGNLHMFKERNPQACLTKGSYAGCHTRWRGLESHLFTVHPALIARNIDLTDIYCTYHLNNFVSFSPTFIKITLSVVLKKT